MNGEEAAQPIEFEPDDFEPAPPRTMTTARPVEFDPEDFEPAAPQQPATRARPVEFDPEDFEPPHPDEERSPIGSGVRSFLLHAPGAIGAAGGFALGAGLAAPTAPVTAGVGPIAAGLATGAAGAYGAEKLFIKGANLLGFHPEVELAADRAVNPTASDIGEALTMGIGGAPGRAAQLASRGIGAGIGAAFETGSEWAQGEKLDPSRIAVQAGAGALFPNPRAWMKGLEERGAVAAGRVVPHGSAGPTAAGGTAQEPPPASNEPVGDPHNKTTVGGTGAPETGGENLNTDAQYGKEAAARAEGVPVSRETPQVAGVDPAIAAAMREAMPEAEAAPGRTMAAERAGDETLVGPEPGRVVQPAAPAEPAPAAAPAKPAPLTIARDADTGRHVLFRGDETLGEYPTRGEALKARNRALMQQVAERRAAEAQQPPQEGAASGSGGATPPGGGPPEGAVPPEPEGRPASLSAAAAGAALPPPPPAGWASTIRAGWDRLLDFSRSLGRDVQMKVAPMAAGSKPAMAVAKDFANWNRRIDTEAGWYHDFLTKNFDKEQLERMWTAADEESVMRQRGETSEHIGIATLTPAERAAVDRFQPIARDLWQQARDIGLVKAEEGLPYYTPRMIAKVAGDIGPRDLNEFGRRGVSTTSPNLKYRKYMEAEETEAAAKARLGEGAELVRDIRTMPMALAKMERAIAGRTLINKIKEIGRQAGKDTVLEGHVPSGEEGQWFTHANNPAFSTYRPRFGPDGKPLLKEDGTPIIDRVPLYMRTEFEGPLKAILTKPSGANYQAAMRLKSAATSWIMYSPLIHNAVEWGRAFPAMPTKLLTGSIYFEGNAAKKGVPYKGMLPYIYDHLFGNAPRPDRVSPTMLEAIDAGLVPIGKRFFNQDITGLMERPNLTPGRSLAAKLAGFVGDLASPTLGDKWRSGIDRLGDFWHNTMLWDRIGDLQMGLYVNLRDKLIKGGENPLTAQRVAAHWANRYAGALPQEAMSDAARKVANLVMFSRSFTVGNLGVMKDMLNGLPRDVRAQIERDFGSLNAASEKTVKGLAQRKAIAVVMADVGLFYIMNSLIQSGINVMSGASTPGKELEGYKRRAGEALQHAGQHPLDVLDPTYFPQRIASTYENEPQLQSRIVINPKEVQAGGRAIGMRNPFGKIGEEFLGYMFHPAERIKAKASTLVRPVWEILDNDKGFGQKVYDPHPDTVEKMLPTIGRSVAHLLEAQLPGQSVIAAKNLATGEGDQRINALQALGPLAGFTFSQGHPGGRLAAEASRYDEGKKFQIQQALPDIRKKLQSGDREGAIKRMKEVEMPQGLQRFYLAPHLSRRAIDEMRRAPEEVRSRFQRERAEAALGLSQ
jgi:hypothetical protein